MATQAERFRNYNPVLERDRNYAETSSNQSLVKKLPKALQGLTAIGLLGVTIFVSINTRNGLNELSDEMRSQSNAQDWERQPDNLSIAVATSLANNNKLLENNIDQNATMIAIQMPTSTPTRAPTSTPGNSPTPVSDFCGALPEKEVEGYQCRMPIATATATATLPTCYTDKSEWGKYCEIRFTPTPNPSEPLIAGLNE